MALVKPLHPQLPKCWKDSNPARIVSFYLSRNNCFSSSFTFSPTSQNTVLFHLFPSCFFCFSHTSRLSSHFHRRGWCQDSGAGLESVWCDQSVPCSPPQVLLQRLTPFGGPLLHTGSRAQAALHPDGRLQGAFVKRVRLPLRTTPVASCRCKFWRACPCILALPSFDRLCQNEGNAKMHEGDPLGYWELKFQYIRLESFIMQFQKSECRLILVLNPHPSLLFLLPRQV